MSKEIIDLIDKLKTIGIILVLIGHTYGINEFTENFIFSFHMPLFFFISGFVISNKTLNFNIIKSIKHYNIRLIIPYLLFSLLSFLPWVFITRLYGSEAYLETNPFKPLIGTFYGIGIDDWLQHNAMLWFFPALFVVHILFKFILLNKSRIVPLLVILIAIFGLFLKENLSFRLPWGFEIALIVMPFYYCGFCLVKYISIMYIYKNWFIFFLSILLILQICFIEMNGRVDVNYLSINNPIIFYMAGFSGIFGLIFLSSLIPSFNIFHIISKATILIFPLHRPIFSSITGILMLIGIDTVAFKETFISSILYSTMGVLICLLLHPIFKSYLKPFIGFRK